MEGEVLVCADCGAHYEFPAEERRQFETRGFAPPKRCRACRAAKRRRAAERAAGAPAGGAPHPAGSPPREKPAAPKHPATCSVCKEATEVPFMPDGVRPVFCLACLKQQTR